VLSGPVNSAGNEQEREADLLWLMVVLADGGGSGVVVTNWGAEGG